jgi:hypothetical protein
VRRPANSAKAADATSHARRQCLQSLQELPKQLPPQLTALKLDGCAQLRELPPLPATLATMSMADCGALQGVLKVPPALQRLELRGCEQLDALSALPTTLQQLQLAGCDSLQTWVHAVCSATILTELCAPWQDDPERASTASGLALLEQALPRCTRLHIKERVLSDVACSALSRCGAVTELELSSMQSWPDALISEALPAMHQLQCLTLRACAASCNLDLRGLSGLPGLTMLAVCKCPGLKQVPNVKGLALAELKVSAATTAHDPESSGQPAVDERNSPATPCKMSFQMEKLFDRFGELIKFRSGDVADLRKQLDEARLATVQRALLSDRDARRDSLQNLSVVAVLLATAAYVAFAQTPSPPAFGADAGSAAVAPAQASKEHAIAVSLKWLRRFFRADQVAFAFAMCAVLIVLVASLPRMRVEDRAAAAGRFWVVLLLLSAVLGTAVVAGMLSFVFAGIAFYPQDWLWRDVGSIGIVAVLVMLAILHWGVSFWFVYPAAAALRAGVKSMLSWQRRNIEVPTPGTDESAHAMLELMRRDSARAEAARAATTSAAAVRAEAVERRMDAMERTLGALLDGIQQLVVAQDESNAAQREGNAVQQEGNALLQRLVVDPAVQAPDGTAAPPAAPPGSQGPADEELRAAGSDDESASADAGPQPGARAASASSDQ